jgi:hypothetical protein
VTDQSLELRVQVTLDPDADPGEVEEHTLQLRDELVGLDIEDIRRPQGECLPEGTRAADVALLGTLVITTGKEAVAAVARTIMSWLGRSRSRSVKLQLGEDRIELTAVSHDDQRRLLEAFLERHAATSA